MVVKVRADEGFKTELRVHARAAGVLRPGLAEIDRYAGGRTLIAQRIEAGAAAEIIVPRSAVDQVVAGAAQQGVVTAQAGDGVIASETIDEIGGVVAGQDIVTRGGYDGVDAMGCDVRRIPDNPVVEYDLVDAAPIAAQLIGDSYFFAGCIDMHEHVGRFELAVRNQFNSSRIDAMESKHVDVGHAAVTNPVVSIADG